jgi:hypothetical protein
MTPWVKLHLIVEGFTEFTFARNTLKPHLARCHVSLDPFMLPTNRKVGAVGGALTWDRFHDNVGRLLKAHNSPADHFSTMVDWYKLDPDFPGFEEARKLARPIDRVQDVEKAVSQFFGSRRFVPFFTLHEFEALLFCDLSVLSTRMPGHEKEIERLRTDIGSVQPEDIDEGEATHPSARLEKRLPGYGKAKVRIGAPAVGAIGLTILREKCPHFGQWLTRLENLRETL